MPGSQGIQSTSNMSTSTVSALKLPPRFVPLLRLTFFCQRIDHTLAHLRVNANDLAPWRHATAGSIAHPAPILTEFRGLIQSWFKVKNHCGHRQFVLWQPKTCLRCVQGGKLSQSGRSWLLGCREMRVVGVDRATNDDHCYPGPSERRHPSSAPTTTTYCSRRLELINHSVHHDMPPRDLEQ